MSNDSLNTAMKVLADKQYDEMLFNTPMRIADAASIFRRPVNKNERPYDMDVIIYNNTVVEEWYMKLLLGIADKQSAIPSGRVTQCFQTFLQGKELQQHQKYKEYFPDYSEDKINFWINKFKTVTMTELAQMGHGVVSAGWNVILMGMRYHFADKKWEKIYCQTNDPVEWDRAANANPHLMHGRPMPFGLSVESLKEIEDKVMSVLKHPIEPK
jgi:hypothetical protein